MVYDQEIEECPEYNRRTKMYFTYILLCTNDKYYVGHTKDTELRFVRHKNKQGAKYTRQNTPVKILWKQDFKTEIKAIKKEKQIKGWSRLKKDYLIKGV